MRRPVQRYSGASSLVLRSPQWFGLVQTQLRQGYGVEDIALYLNCYVGHVRDYVSAMRKGGVLANLYPTEKPRSD